MIRVGKCRFGLFFQLEGLPRWFAQAVYYGGLPWRFTRTFCSDVARHVPTLVRPIPGGVPERLITGQCRDVACHV